MSEIPDIASVRKLAMDTEAWRQDGLAWVLRECANQVEQAANRGLLSVKFVYGESFVLKNLWACAEAQRLYRAAGYVFDARFDWYSGSGDVKVEINWAHGERIPSIEELETEVLMQLRCVQSLPRWAQRLVRRWFVWYGRFLERWFPRG